MIGSNVLVDRPALYLGQSPIGCSPQSRVSSLSLEYPGWTLPLTPASRQRSRRIAIMKFIALLLLILPLQAQAQSQTPPGQVAATESVTVVPGARYRAGWLHRLFLGNHYRNLWTTPVRVEVLDLDTFAGGLKATRRGGGRANEVAAVRGRGWS